MKALFFFTFVLISGALLSQDQMFEICPIKVGSELPTVAVYDQNNKENFLADLTAEKPTVLIFYRGAWCGYCTKHLSELNEIKAEIDSMGYQIFGITVDQTSKLAESTIRSESEIQVYSDSKLEAIKAFGLDWNVDDQLFAKYKEKYQLDLEEWSGTDHHSLPVPAIFIVKDGSIQFQYVNPNYRTRLNPATLLAILKTM